MIRYTVFEGFLKNIYFKGAHFASLFYKLWNSEYLFIYLFIYHI